MEVRAKAKFVRISPRKVRLVVDLVRGLGAVKALSQLKFVNKKSAHPVYKLVESGLANAENNYNLDRNNLFIKEIRVDEGKTLKRIFPRAYGRAAPIRKRTSHISVVIGEIKDSGVVEAKKQEVEAPVSLEELSKQAEEGNKKNTKKKIDKKDVKKEKKKNDKKQEDNK
ncbi:50S ribosomal protein L22 [bacterium]|nr:50S ribosomal protein L22 [bacterium]